MTQYTDDELQRLIESGESDRVEFKASAADRKMIRRNVCAFANDLAGHGQAGVILIGVTNSGDCSNIVINDRLLQPLAAMRDDGNLQPLPSLEVYRRRLRDCDVAVVQVEPVSAPPVRYEGRVWVKVGPTTRQATTDEELRLTERRRAGERSFDMRPAEDAKLEDLDLDYAREQYIPRAVAEEVLEQNERPLEQQLKSLRLMAGGDPTWGALLGLGKDPQAWLAGARVQFLRIDGERITDPIKDQKELTGRLEDVLLRLADLLDINVSVRTIVEATTREIRRPDYPVTALRQLAQNAVMHRSYEGTNAPVKVYWYADRVEITNPGGLYGKVEPANFGEGMTDYRNPLVAEIMHHLGFAQRFGMGIPLARKALADNGNPPPEFAFSPTHVAVTVRSAE